jgi:hypothetical protein
MWEKLADGVLRVVTPLGPRYIKPSFLQRVYLVWMFRYFASLPHQVLRPRQQKMIDLLCTSHAFVSQRPHNGREQAPIVGTVVQRPLVLVDKPPARGPVVAFAESAFQVLFAASGLNSVKGVIVKLSRLAQNVRSKTLSQTARGLAFFHTCFLALRRERNGLVQTELKDRSRGNDLMIPCLPLGEHLGSCTSSGANGSSDGRALSVSKSSTIDCGDYGSASGHLSRAFVGAPGGAGSPAVHQGQARDHSRGNGPSIQSGPSRYSRPGALGSNCESK